MKTLNPYLNFPGTCREAIQFYKEALNGEIVSMQTFEEAHVPVPDAQKQRIMHSVLRAEGVLIMAADGMPGTKEEPGNMTSLLLDLTDAGEQERIFTALSAGGVVTQPLQDTFWGARYGALTDRFGINWMLNHDKSKG